MGIFHSQVGEMGVKLGRSGNGLKETKIQVLRMAFSIVENVPTAHESIFELCPVSQRPYRAKH